jgi:hypothetical protein
MSNFNKPTKTSPITSAFDIKGPSIWSRDAIAKRQAVALKAANTEFKNRGLRVRDEFTTYTKARGK